MTSQILKFLDFAKTQKSKFVENENKEKSEVLPRLLLLSYRSKYILPKRVNICDNADVQNQRIKETNYMILSPNKRYISSFQNFDFETNSYTTFIV